MNYVTSSTLLVQNLFSVVWGNMATIMLIFGGLLVYQLLIFAYNRLAEYFQKTGSVNSGTFSRDVDPSVRKKGAWTEYKRDAAQSALDYLESGAKGHTYDDKDGNFDWKKFKKAQRKANSLYMRKARRAFQEDWA